MIVDRFEGAVPADYAVLISLDGVGPYTARAVQSFAFGAHVTPVDTNIHRVLERAAVGRSLTPSSAQAVADGLMPGDRVRDWNLALMDFGSLVCTASSSRCGDCPLRVAGACAWRCHSPGDAVDPARVRRRRSPRQSRFAGSDREGRGRLVRAAFAGPIAADKVQVAAGWPDQPDRARAVVERLVSEGLLVRDRQGDLRLP